MLEQWENRPLNTTCDFFNDGDSLIAAHSKLAFDIILLDIVMPLFNGIDTARKIREYDPAVKIVFLTSSPEFALDSYSVKASDYLLKPVDPSRLFASLSSLVAELPNCYKTITVKGKNAVHRIPLPDIEYVESQGKLIIFSLINGRRIESLEPLYTYEGKLTVEDGFFKCHRSYIVCIHHINYYTHSDITMRSGTVLPISRSCQKDFESTYFSVVFGKAGDDV